MWRWWGGDRGYIVYILQGVASLDNVFLGLEVDWGLGRGWGRVTYTLYKFCWVLPYLRETPHSEKKC